MEIAYQFCLVAALGLAARVAVGQQPQAPPMPNQFQVTIEATLILYNQTLNLREWNDGVARKARYEIQTAPNQMTAYIVDWATNQVWTIVNLQQCSVKTFDLRADPFGYLPPGYLGLEFLARFNASLSDAYLGQQLIRGVLSDGWQSRLQNNRSSSYGSVMDVQFWWSVPGWGRQFASSNASRPMRASVNGTRTWNITFLNGTTDAGSHVVDNDYEFVDFIPGPVLPSYFELPDPCLPIAEATIRFLLSHPEQSGGLAAGMFFLGLVVGVILWVLISLCYRKYKERRGWKWQSMQTQGQPLRDGISL